MSTAGSDFTVLPRNMWSGEYHLSVLLSLFRDSVENCFDLWSLAEELRDLFAAILPALSAIGQAAPDAAGPDLTLAAVTKNPGTVGNTAVAIDVTGLETAPKLLRPFLGHLGPGLVVIVLRGDVGRAFRADQSATGNDLGHH